MSDKETRRIEMIVAQSGSGKEQWMEQHREEYSDYTVISFDEIIADIEQGIKDIAQTNPNMPLKDIANQYLDNTGNKLEGYTAKYWNEQHPKMIIDDILGHLGNEPYNNKPFKEYKFEDPMFKNYLELAGYIYHAKITKAVENGENILIDKNNRTAFVRKEALDIAKGSDKYQYESTALYIPPSAQKTASNKPFEPPQKNEFDNVEEIRMTFIEKIFSGISSPRNR